MIKILLLGAGFLSLILGIIGIFLPLLPTTPFLLLSAGCFLKSSRPLYDWITNHRVFGKYLRYYLKYKGMTGKTKVTTLLFLWGCIIISILIVDILWVRILLLFIASAVTLHILILKTITRQMIEEDRKDQAMGPTDS